MKLEELFSLKGKVALVTGGGRGIGKFISEGLAEAGADLIITSRKMPNLEAAAKELSQGLFGARFTHRLRHDQEDEIEGMVQTALKTFPRIDILVNNAGATWGAPHPTVSPGKMGLCLQCQCPFRLDPDPKNGQPDEGLGGRYDYQHRLYGRFARHHRRSPSGRGLQFHPRRPSSF
jgi:NAD(P)-dependent dehydrogenase (short-subunit alcohol dehydrogenase family)